MQNDFGLISIIMAAYNAEKTIEQAINSVLSQTYPDFELLVVNDCSTDKTAMLAEAIVKKDGRVRLISNEITAAFLTPGNMGWKKLAVSGSLFLTAMMRGHRRNWKSRSSFKRKQMQTCCLPDRLSWMRMENQSTGI